MRPNNTNSYARSASAESGAATSPVAAADLRRKKLNKLILYIILFEIFETGIILILSLTVMKVRTPEFRLRSATLTNLAIGTPASPSFSATMNAEFAIKNNNFGRYKYQNTTVEFMYGGTPAGQAIVRSSSAKWKSTNKFDVEVGLNLPASSRLASDLRDGFVTLSSRAKMKGRVEFVFVVKKERSATMNCSLEIVVANQLIRNIACK